MVKTNKYLFIAITILAVLTAVLAFREYGHIQSESLKDSQILALTDTVTVYRTKDGKNGAYIRVLQGSKKQISAILENKRPDLSVAVKEKGLHSFTEVITKTVIDTIVRVDTLVIATDTNKFYAEKTITDPYYTQNIVVNGDSIRSRIEMIDSLSIKYKDKSNGFWRAKSYVVDVTNRNPYVKPIGLTGIEIKPKTHTGLKVGLGILIGAVAIFLIK